MPRRDEEKVRIDNLTLEDFILQDEGLKLRPYWDTEGYLTIGCGCNLGIRIADQKMRESVELPAWDVISEGQARNWLKEKVDQAELELFKAFPTCMHVTDRRYYVLVGMVYNLGINSFLGFKKMIAAIEAEDYEAAGRQILNSKAARQLPERYGRYARMMREG